ncbi:unnamed protein product [Zymoseptoria tritici ST99CH_3D7]|uniref:Uncharacterized protein n=1 Tax=Zymoseptoria tritici (strain ST99CH_3D7) TaxID=1276538 RepID=A0A1X7RC61_ZYMT9|nr:unnamed protein product [Zymoseptoria tritici ST99CH_3D7]
MLTIDLQMMKTIAVSCLPRGFFSRSFQELAVAAPDDLAAKRIVAACQVMVDKEKKKVRDAKAAAGEATPFAATPAGKGKTWPSAPFSTGSFSSTMSSMGTLNDSQPMKIDNTREYRYREKLEDERHKHWRWPLAVLSSGLRHQPPR